MNNTEIYKNKSLENLDGEIWVDIDDYEGLYKVSNLGRIKSLDFNHTGKVGILTQKDNNYLEVKLSKNKIPKYKSVHRLVAIAFIPNPLNKPQVNHISGDKTDNRISNLEWNTRSENMQHAYDIGLNKKGKEHHWFGKGKEHYLFGRIGKENPTSKIIYQYTLQGDFIKKWDSLSDIKRELNYNIGNISLCANGKYKSAGGYFWSYQIIKNNN